MKKIFITFAAFLFITSIGVAILFGRIAQPMKWYTVATQIQQGQENLAERAEFRLTEEFHKVRPPKDSWKLRIQSVAINAWLSFRLEDWLTHREGTEFPSEFRSPLVQITPDGIWVAGLASFDTALDSNKQPIAVKFQLQILEDKLTVKTVAVRLGKLPLPLSMLGMIGQDLKDLTFTTEAVVQLMDDRAVNIRQVKLEDGALVLTCETCLQK